MNRDPWEVLGVGREASAEELRAAYRRLAATLHPDRIATAPAAERRRAEEQLQEVGEAYALARAAADARDRRTGAGQSSGSGFHQPPPFRAGPAGSQGAARGPGSEWAFADDPTAAEDDQPVEAHVGRGCGLVTLLILGVVGALFVGTALLTGGGGDGPVAALAPWRLERIGVREVPLAFDAWRSSPAAGRCQLLVPTGLSGQPDTSLVQGGWSGDWDDGGLTTRGDRNDVPRATGDDVPLVWTDGSRGVAQAAGAQGWVAYLVINGEPCRHEVRADGDFDDLARVLGSLRRVATGS